MIAASISGCFGKEEKIGGDKISVKYDQTLTNELVAASNTFAFDLNKALSSDQNTFFSPYSITIALGMAYNRNASDCHHGNEQ